MTGLGACKFSSSKNIVSTYSGFVAIFEAGVLHKLPVDSRVFAHVLRGTNHCCMSCRQLRTAYEHGIHFSGSLLRFPASVPCCNTTLEPFCASTVCCCGSYCIDNLSRDGCWGRTLSPSFTGEKMAHWRASAYALCWCFSTKSVCPATMKALVIPGL